jgi:excinuclease ABC subunit A
VDGQVYDLDHVPELNPKQNHHIDAVVDRVIIRAGIENRLTESIQLAVRHSDGLVAVLYYDEHTPEAKAEAAANGNGQNGHNPGVWRDVLYSTRYACPDCKISFEELEPRTFSFNSPYGACPDCEGLGERTEFDPELVLPDTSLSLASGAIAPWKNGTPGETKKHSAALTPFLTANKLSEETPLAEYKPKQLEKLLHGDEKKFPGLLILLEKELATATRENKRQHLEAFRGSVTCRTCGGSRLRREANSVRLMGKAIHEITRLTIGEAREFFASVTFGSETEPIGEPLVEEIEKRLAFLDKVGVTYLTLDRAADTLSGGELQRVRLATCIGSGLVGVCYVLDEPSIGLHPRDNQRLIEAIRDLQQQGNTVIVVEHDEAIMRHADWLIDIGPGAGQHGGRVVAQGTPLDVQANEDSITGNYLSGRKEIEVPAKRRRASKTRSITIEGVTTNNLKNITVHFPLNTLCCVTGVSGSGKSSLVNETLARALVRRLGGVAPKPGPHTSLRGASQIDKIIEIDQSPIGRSPRSNPATYVGAFDEIRKIFAATREAKQYGFKANRFSFNVEGGRCEHCQGQGSERIEMNFLPDLYVTCSECDGKRFNRQTLAVKWRGKSVADILEMSVDEAAAFFESFTNIHRLLVSLSDVGLGYLGLGQSSTTLSGGEAQRIKLAAELARTETGSTLYLLDEPTTGLHFDDIKKLLGVLSRLVDKGNTVIVIEHNLDVIKTADWLIDLGPEGGSAGGHIAAVGTPEELAFRLDDNHTGRYLRGLLETKRT